MCFVGVMGRWQSHKHLEEVHAPPSAFSVMRVLHEVKCVDSLALMDNDDLFPTLQNGCVFHRYAEYSWPHSYL